MSSQVSNSFEKHKATICCFYFLGSDGGYRTQESVLLLLSSLSSTTDNNTLKVTSNHVKLIFKLTQQIAVALLLNELVRLRVTEFLRPLLLPKFSDFKIRYFNIFQHRYLFLSKTQNINIVGNSGKEKLHNLLFCKVICLLLYSLPDFAHISWRCVTKTEVAVPSGGQTMQCQQ